MNIIFLDMDGVLASARIFHADNNDLIWSSIDIHAARFISRIAYRWPAKIVISSTWRKMIDYSHWQYIFQGTDLFSQLHNQWKTPDLKSGHRGDEIDSWIKSNNFQGNYLIFDDSDDFKDHHRNNLIQPDVNDGMLTAHYRKTINLLNGKYGVKM